MIRFVVAKDEANAALGTYFDASKNYLDGLAGGIDTESDLHVMNSKECKRTYVSDTLPKVCGEKPFIFVVFSHGNEKACVAGGVNYIDEGNVGSFKNSFFYSTACLNGRELGVKLVEEGCEAFVGFTEESNAYSIDEYREVFIKCDLACLSSFLSKKDKTLKEAESDAISYFNMQIDKLDSLTELLIKGALIENREALRVLGNKELKRENLEFIENDSHQEDDGQQP